MSTALKVVGGNGSDLEWEKSLEYKVGRSSDFVQKTSLRIDYDNLSSMVPNRNIMNAISSVSKAFLTISCNQCLGFLVISQVDDTIRANYIVEEADMCSDYLRDQSVGCSS